MILLAVILYFVPTLIAFIRNLFNKGVIFWLNLLLGWTIIGWLGVFIWSLVESGATITVHNNYQAPRQPMAAKAQPETTESKRAFDRMALLKKLKQLLDEGVLSREEFEKEKSKILLRD